MEASNTPAPTTEPAEMFIAAELAALDLIAEMSAEEFWGLDLE